MSIWDVIPEIDVQGLLRRIPRPERSGVLSTILHYSLLISLLTAGAAVDPDVLCLIHPSSCQLQETKQDVIKKWNYVMIFPGKGDGKKLCLCGLEWRLLKDAQVFRLERQIDWGGLQISCDNDFSEIYWPLDWETIFAEGQVVEQERFHCDKEGKP